MNHISLTRTLKANIAFSFLISLLIFPQTAFSNNLSVSNVTLEKRTPSSNTVVVEFDLSWENSWRTKIDHDAAWITIRLNDPTVSPTDKKLCQVTSSGTNPSGTSIDSSFGLEIYVPADKMGAFIRPSTFGAMASVNASNIELTIDYSTCGFTNSDEAKASVLGIEMVYIPQGEFYAGDNDTSTASLDQGSADSDPWYIDGAGAISVSNPASDGYRYVSAANTGEDPTGSSFTIAENFPEGYGAFYVMKYEITEGQWVEFLNALPSSAARSKRDLTNTSHKNSDTVIKRNTISCSGSPLTCSSLRPYRALSYLTWMDLAAFLDWAGLRPMSELEFEKMARGPVVAFDGEYSWGTTGITAAAAISAGAEDGTETVTTSGANVHYNSTVLSGGDTGSGAEYQQGPLRSGIFATSASDRVSSGGSYYGVMELSGNLSERVVTIGNSTGRSFTGTHGDGVLSTAFGYEGNATNTDWPGIDGVIVRGVTGAAGSGFKGGSWSDVSGALRISDRTNAANASTQAFNNAGGRGVRSDDE